MLARAARNDSELSVMCLGVWALGIISLQMTFKTMEVNDVKERSRREED